ncbi:WD40-repeat-containing domain protein [Cladochytrium replicatum]|nr:WD40-repeat-containing domain protein [Cladochytrium replicatum]
MSENGFPPLPTLSSNSPSNTWRPPAGAWTASRQSQGQKPNSEVDPRLAEKIPVEVLIHIFSKLDTHDLRKGSLVCRRWARVIKDDTCWRLALEWRYGRLPIRRVAPTWQKEYLRRGHLTRDWSRRRGTESVQFDPFMVGRITEIMVDYAEGKMFAGSLERGCVAMANPITGKIERDLIYSRADEIPDQISALKMDKFRILAGFGSGEMVMITDFLDRGPSRYTLKRFTSHHNRSVNCFACKPKYVEVVLSGSEDGTVKVWDFTTLLCVRTLGTGAVTINPDAILHVDFDPKAHVIAATASGKLLIWDIDLTSLISNHAIVPPDQSNSGPVLIPTRTIVVRPTPPPGTDPAPPKIAALLWDPAISTAITISKALVSEGGVMRWNVRDGSQVGIFLLPNMGEKVNVGAWDRIEFGPNPTGSSYLVTGHEGGTIVQWLINDKISDDDAPPARSSSRLSISSASSPRPSIANPSKSIVRPLRVLRLAHASPITHVVLDPWKIVSASQDGTVKVWDLLTGDGIRALLVRAVRAAGGGWHDDVARHAIGCLWIGPHQVIATVGGSQIKTWNFQRRVTNTSAPGKRKDMRNRARANANNARIRGAQQSQQQREYRDWRDEVRLTRDEMEAERRELHAQREHEAKLRGMSLGLSDEELLSYALMVSMEEQEQQEFSRVVDESLVVSGAPETPTQNPRNIQTPRLRGQQQQRRGQNQRRRMDAWEDEWDEEAYNDEWHSALEADEDYSSYLVSPARRSTASSLSSGSERDLSSSWDGNDHGGGAHWFETGEDQVLSGSAPTHTLVFGSSLRGSGGRSGRNSVGGSGDIRASPVMPTGNALSPVGGDRTVRVSPRMRGMGLEGAVAARSGHVGVVSRQSLEEMELELALEMSLYDH